MIWGEMMPCSVRADKGDCDNFLARVSRNMEQTELVLYYNSESACQTLEYLWMESHYTCSMIIGYKEISYGQQQICFYNSEYLNRKMDNRNWLLFALLLVYLPVIETGTGVSPLWVASSYFKAGGVTFTYTAGSTNQNSTITYSSAIVNGTLKKPTLGITDLNYQIAVGKIYLLIQVVSYTNTFLNFNVVVNANLYLTTLKLTYMALDNLFTPPFSMNNYFPNVGKTGPNITAQFYVNFTSSTGVTLNTSHENVLLPFMHYIDCNTSDTTINIDLNFTLLNSSFYTVIITSSSKMTLNYAGFSRLIFDKTDIEAMGNDYFNYGIIHSFNNNATTLSTTIPPDIIPQNLFYGMHSFTIKTGLSQLNYISSYNITSGFIGYTSQGTYVYSEMKFSYMHHKTRKCPASNPYYNITEKFCYDVCATRWYGDVSTMACDPCLYDCLTCTTASTCATCDNTSDHRILSSNRCAAAPGYYDSGTNNSVAQPCTSPCATCVTAATYCLSCISGYYLQGSSCLSCSAAIPSCSTCNNASFCTLCNSGGNGTTCTTCTSSQYKNANNTCVACSSAIAYCQSCTSSTNCTLCQTTFTLVSATNCSCVAGQYLASGQCNSCASAMSNCATCTSATSCSTCSSTFTLVSASNCTCNTTTFLNSTSNQCKSCTLITQYCQTCTNTTCTACLSNFTLTNGTCMCQAGYYANSTTSNCQSCTIISNCLACSNSSMCTTCATGYKVNETTGACDVQPCTVSNCDTCVANSTTICQSCYSGYSVGPNGTSCQSCCGNYALDSNQDCDDGNTVSGDGCSSLCKNQTDFTCYSQYINSTNSYSWCFYTSTITFSQVWIRKFEGNNSLKFEFQLQQTIKQWQTVDFTSILGIDQYDTSTKISLGVSSSIISSYYATYEPLKNRFNVIVNYMGSSMQKTNLVFALSPYAHNAYPAFTPPNNVEFNAPNIELRTTVLANNNQNANLYTQSEYNLYSVSIWVTYFVVGLAMLGVLTSLVFRTAKVIAFEMITIMQITYFSLAFLDSMNPAYSGMLPMRYLAGILTFQDVQLYLEELTSPNSMKGIYMFLNMSQNLSWVALGLISFLGFGLLLMLIYMIYDHLVNPDSPHDEIIPIQQKKGFWMHQLAFHFIGELSLSLIFLCLPIYTVSLFFQILFTLGQTKFWSIAQALGLGLAFLAYFIALLKSDPPNQNSTSRLGEYISEFNCLGCFKIFKYGNLQIIETLIISGLVMATIYSNSKIFSALCIVLTAVVDIVIVAVVKPYRYGFVSCFKGEDNDTEILFEKIELYKIYDKKQPTILRIKQPDMTQKSEQNQNNSELFTQHFATRRNVIKSKHQGLVQAGQTLNHTKLFLFNNNNRRIANLTTLIVVQFVFICSQIYAAEINKSYGGVSIQNMLPLLINMMMTVNVIYNYAMIVLQILDRRKHNSSRVEVLPDSASFNLRDTMQQRYTNKKQRSLRFEKSRRDVQSTSLNKHLQFKTKKKEELQVLDQFDEQRKNVSQATNINIKDSFRNNNLVIKRNSVHINEFLQTKPQVIKSGKKGIRKHRRNFGNQIGLE